MAIDSIYEESDLRYPHIVEICDKLTLQGERPSAAKVRSVLGKGSNSDLQNGVDEWWLTINPRLKYYLGNPQLDHKVIDAAAKLWKVAMGRASETFETERHQYELRFQENEKVLNNLKNSLNETESDLQNTRIQLNESNQSAQVISQDLDQLRNSLVESKGELSAALATIEGMKDAKLGVESRNADLLEQLSLVKSESSDLQTELKETTQLLSEIRQESAIRQRDIASLKNRLDQEEKAAEEKIRQAEDEALKTAIESKRALDEIVTVQSELAVEKEKCSELGVRNVELGGRISELSLELKSTQHELGSQREANATILASLESCRIQLDKSETRLDKVINKD